MPLYKRKKLTISDTCQMSLEFKSPIILDTQEKIEHVETSKKSPVKPENLLKNASKPVESASFERIDTSDSIEIQHFTSSNTSLSLDLLSSTENYKEEEVCPKIKRSDSINIKLKKGKRNTRNKLCPISNDEDYDIKTESKTLNKKIKRNSGTKHSKVDKTNSIRKPIVVISPIYSNPQISSKNDYGRNNVLKTSNQRTKLHKVKKIDVIKEPVVSSTPICTGSQNSQVTFIHEHYDKRNISKSSNQRTKSNIRSKLHKNDDNEPVVFRIGSQSSQVSMNEPLIKKAYISFMKSKEAVDENIVQLDTSLQCSHKEEMLWLQKQRDVGLYVHCDNCNKLRYLQSVKDPTELPEKWYCTMNTDKFHNKCDILEVDIPLSVYNDLINNLYNAGSIVWAKVEGYPWWPGIVDDDPDTETYYWLDDEYTDTPSWYHVTFFDEREVTRSWLRTMSIKSFIGEKNNFDLLPSPRNIYKKRLDYSIKMAETAIKMSILERLEKFSFVTRYRKPIRKSNKYPEIENVLNRKRNNSNHRMSSKKSKKRNTNDENIKISRSDISNNNCNEKNSNDIKNKSQHPKKRANDKNRNHGSPKYVPELNMSPNLAIEDVSFDLFDNFVTLDI